MDFISDMRWFFQTMTVHFYYLPGGEALAPDNCWAPIERFGY